MAWNKNSAPFIFLATTILFTFLFQEASGAIGKKGHHDSCNADRDCDSGYCEPHTRKCECGFLDKKSKSFYDYDLKMCFSRIGQVCTFSSVDDDLPAFNCVPNAECTSSGHITQSKAFFGHCRCKSGHTPSSDGKLCTSNAELRTGKVSSMDQVRPEGWSRSGSMSLFRTNPHQFSVYIVSVLICIFPFR